MRSITIRDMQTSDVPEVAAIERASFSTPWSENSLYGEVYGRYSIARVAVLDDRVAGFIIARLILDEGHLLDLAVHPDYRKRGIAGMLVKDVIRGLQINSCRSFFLEVRASNNAAKVLYGNLGFKIISTRKDYYKNPVEDALVMKLEI